MSIFAVHESTPQNSRLGELMQATMAALKIEGQDDPYDHKKYTSSQLAHLFGVAQQADVTLKFEFCL
jgi:hypothetical protein